MNLFSVEFPVIGMIHLLPLPGSPRFTDIQSVIHQASHDYQALRDGGVDGVLIENFGDIPFPKERVSPHVVAWMMRIVLSLGIDVPFGINVLRNDAISALAVAHATGAHFIRCNILTGAMVTDQGMIEGKSAEVLRYRSLLKCDVRIFADVHVKHAVPLVVQPIERVARDTAYRGLADGLIVTGAETGDPPTSTDMRAVKGAVPDKPLFAGSGTTHQTVPSIIGLADGCIVGKAFKKEGMIENPVDRARVESFMQQVKDLR
ncbi:MAG: BtpA/SgcQ family protein [Theionarchaea archaeon]|nr:BtpA/SgcQ family protein [Theionarchaea archaeon]MBU7036943.1 BtpA/SgcQ family protein [Theionarchaea archaeon]